MAAKEKEAPALPEGQAENPKKRSRLKRIIIIAAILLMTLSGAGLGAYWWLYLRTPAAGEAAPEDPAATAPASAQNKAQPNASAGHGATPAGQAGRWSRQRPGRP